MSTSSSTYPYYGDPEPVRILLVSKLTSRLELLGGLYTVSSSSRYPREQAYRTGLGVALELAELRLDLRVLADKDHQQVWVHDRVGAEGHLRQAVTHNPGVALSRHELRFHWSAALQTTAAVQDWFLYL